MTEPFTSDDIPWAALGRYLAGELPPDERAAVERWIGASPDHAQLVEELRRLWGLAPDFRQHWEVEAAIRRVTAQPAAEPAQVIRLPAFYREAPMSRAKRLRRFALRAAAVVALLGGGILAIWRPTSNDTAISAAASEIRTLPGQRAELRLPDGSEVKLGPATTMRYAMNAQHGARTVELDGEAYFAVTHDEARPFTVRTAYGTAVDRGTRFGIRAYRADSVVEVAVEQGAVALAARPQGRALGADVDGSQVLLMARDVGTATAGGRVTAERKVDVTPYLVWKEGRLELRAIPLREAVVQLGRWYGIDLRLGDSASAERRLRASFQQESAAEAIQLIAATLALRVERRGSAVILWTK